MVLSDVDIKNEVKAGRLVIKPFSVNSLQPASYDVSLGSEFRIFKNTQKAYLDIKEDFSEFMELIKIPKGRPLIIHPGEFLLGTTVERFKLPSYLVAQLMGRSSIARLGIIIHATAGFIDPGFEGHLTLEISNVANIPIALYPSMRVGQVSFTRLTSSAKKPYSQKRGSKYTGQMGPTVSKIWKDF